MKSATCKNLALFAVTLVTLILPIASFADEGTDLFKAKDAMCHGPDGAGKTMMGEKLKIPALQSADVQKKSDADIKTIITRGKDKMPAYEAKLSKEQIEKLAGFIRDLAKRH